MPKEGARFPLRAHRGVLLPKYDSSGIRMILLVYVCAQTGVDFTRLVLFNRGNFDSTYTNSLILQGTAGPSCLSR